MQTGRGVQAGGRRLQTATYAHLLSFNCKRRLLWTKDAIADGSLKERIAASSSK